MKRPASRWMWLAIWSLAGCGGSTINSPGPASPHGGALVSLPDGQGFAEVAKEVEPAKRNMSRVVVYFLDSARKPLATVPTNVSFKLTTTIAKPIQLKPSGEDGRLASDLFPDRGELDGELSASIGGKTVVVPLNVR